GIEHADTQSDVEYLCRKIARLRIFDDPSGVMNLDIKQSQGQVMVVSQFTLHADCSRGNRPSYINAARPEQALPLYELFLEQLSVECSQEVACGTFGATMFIKMVANGPVTILIDSKNR
ncbi:MAG: D-aminoacyl-tRNA deacylase, partial [Mucinivorans sp.]